MSTGVLSPRRDRSRRRRRTVAALLPLIVGAAALAPAPALALAAPAQAPAEEGYRSLDATTGWKQAGPGGFTVAADGARTSYGGLGMTWYQAEEFGSYSFKVDWRYGTGGGNSGIFIGFPPSDDPYSAVNSGYEIQIDPEDGAGNTTGAVYDVKPPDTAAVNGAVRTGPDEWNTYEVLVEGQRVRILLNGTLVNDFTNTDPARGLGRGHIGLQNHGAGDAVVFDNIRIKELAPPGTDFPATTDGGTDAPAQEPGVTLRVFDLQTPQTKLCTPTAGQTPNVDKLLPTIDWTSADVFGVQDYFAAQVTANLNVPSAGAYAFRLISDDGSRLRIDDKVVIDHDNLHSADPPKDGTVTLTQGVHPLRIDHFENRVDQRLTLQWKPPGASAFVVVPNSVLSTDAGAARPTSPGKKTCGQASTPAQEPGVTMRVFDLQTPQTRICTLKTGQTPNVDKLLPTIDWNSVDVFGVEDYFAAQAIANLNAPTAGEYAFRLISDDGSRLTIDGTRVVDHDFLHSAEVPKDGTATLTQGVHPLRIDYFENAYSQRLTLQWKPPGASAFVVVPNTALSTDAGVVRVTAPGKKECEQAGDSPGDGRPLTGVHPSYTLTDFRPAGFEPKVSGLDWFPDGRLAVLTWGGADNRGTPTQAGEVYILSGVTGATGPDKVTIKKVAEGLKEPQGIKIVDGTIYVSEKQRLTRLVDSTGDGVTDTYQTVAELPFGGNFHEFAFGLLYQEPNFLLNLSVSINLGGATTNPQPAANRGTTVQINKDTGAIKYVASGLRTPNGIGYGPEGGIFVTDNQGDWLPVSKLVQIKQDRFFNHRTTPAGPFDQNAVTPPVLWLPQNEIANSPSTPIQVTEGPFAGQMMIGDVTYGGIQRAYLEKIGGEFQGAVFRMTQGLEMGVNRISQGPDGAIYAGGLGAGGNWGQAGKLDHGLQKLTPNGTSTFDILAMRAVPGGFEVEYTEPVSAGTADALIDRYNAQQWRYAPTAAYGGPKIDQSNLSITSATLSADGRKVTLKMDGLKAGHVVYLRSPRPFTSDSGKSLWSTEAWYTLNKLPS